MLKEKTLQYERKWLKGFLKGNALFYAIAAHKFAGFPPLTSD